MEVDTLFFESPQSKFQPQNSKMDDIPVSTKKKTLYTNMASI